MKIKNGINSCSLQIYIVKENLIKITMSLFKRKGQLVINQEDPTYKVKYLGNVQTAMMKGDGCVDKPVGVIWNNYIRTSSSGLEMKLTISTSGLKAFTKEQGLTEYRTHRISYCVAHPKYPKLFVWVYRHEGKKMKMELRCHAVLCKSIAKAKAMALELHEKIKFALSEFVREKSRKQTSRLTLQRTNSLPMNGSVLPKRTQMLSTGQNFKPPISRSNTAPRLGAITEDFEEVEEDLIEEEEEEGDEIDAALESQTLDALTLAGHDKILHECDSTSSIGNIIDIEIGNDIEELKLDSDVQFCLSNGDSDDESSESGFHESDMKEESIHAVDDTSLDGQSVCDVPSGYADPGEGPSGFAAAGYVEEETVVTFL